MAQQIPTPLIGEYARVLINAIPRPAFSEEPIPTQLSWTQTGGLLVGSAIAYEFKPYVHVMTAGESVGSATASAGISQIDIQPALRVGANSSWQFLGPTTYSWDMSGGLLVGAVVAVRTDGSVFVGNNAGAASDISFISPTHYNLSDDGVPQGGVSLDGEALVRELTQVVGSGGVALGGAAPVLEKLPFVPTGGVLVSGSAPPLTVFALVPTGGVLIAGVAPILAVGVVVPSGGVVLAGAAPNSSYVAWFAPSGGVALDGGALMYFVASHITPTTENPYADAYPGWSMNVETNAVARYMGLAANSFTRFKGRTILSNAGGIYEMGADDDNGNQIDASVEFATTDYATSYEKRMEVAYLGLRTTGRMRLKVKVKGKAPQYYALMQDVDSVKGTRVPIGKGLVGRYWGARLDNVDGADFDLDSAEFNPNRGTRHGA